MNRDTFEYYASRNTAVRMYRTKYTGNKRDRWTGKRMSTRKWKKFVAKRNGEK